MKIMFRISLFLLILHLFCYQHSMAQSLEELIRIAHGQSPANDIAETRYLNARLNYNVRQTGGTIFASTGLQRLDILNDP